MAVLEATVRESLFQTNGKTIIGEIDRADILVGVPSFNNAGTIEHVIRAVNAGFAKYFPECKAIIVNSDGGSTDGTPEIVRRAGIENYRTLLTRHPLYPVHKIITPYDGIPGKGSALRTVFKIAMETGVKACAVVDADLRSITPEWIELLITPILNEGYDFVAPLYHRHKYDGTITNSIVYPLTRALYGQRVRQPIGGDFGFSGRLAEHYLTHEVWHSDVARFGIDIWMITTAITGGYKICQSFLGAKIHDAKDPGVDLSAMLTQVVSSVFSLMEIHHDDWVKVRGSQDVPLFGFEYTVGLEPIQVNVERMIDKFHAGVDELSSIWEEVLNEETRHEINQLRALSTERFYLPTNLWVRAIYDFATAWQKKVIHREHLLKSLTPLYLARVASFVRETADADAKMVEKLLEKLCLKFEEFKPYLIERWEP